MQQQAFVSKLHPYNGTSGVVTSMQIELKYYVHKAELV